jgi:two-component system sensor histidine kinase KdpD
LYSVILNGLRNAVQAMEDVCRPGATVCVHAGARRDADGRPWIELTIDDEGPGVPDGFDASSTGPRADGHGIGLGLCRRIVADMGGQLELANRSPDGRERGARLRVRVPAPRDLSDTLIG